MTNPIMMLQLYFFVYVALSFHSDIYVLASKEISPAFDFDANFETNLLVDSKENIVVPTVNHPNSLRNVRTLLSPNPSTCVTTDEQLRNAVAAAPNGVNTTITLCTETIVISSQLLPNGYTGIDISNKIINLRCNIGSNPNQRCTLDGALQTRIFFGYSSHFSAERIIFMKGSTINDSYGPEYIRGGAFYLKDSTVCLDRTSLIDNGSVWGGAIYAENSSITLKGGATRSDGTIFSNNQGSNGGAIYVTKSNICADKGFVIFKYNNEGAIVASESTVNLKSVNFYLNAGMFVSIFR
jgi:predicted outer membrane repeat protein